MICFVLHVFDEPLPQVEVTIAALQRNYPQCQILLIEDGGIHYDIDRVPAIVGARLKTPAHGGQWTHRYLSLFLKHSTAETLIKVDPDTDVLKPATNFPEGNVIFSAVFTHNLGHGKTWRVPHGGALGFTRKAAEELVSLRLFLNPKFIDNIRYLHWNDVMLADIIVRRGMNLVERLDFACGPTKTIGPETTFAHS